MRIQPMTTEEEVKAAVGLKVVSKVVSVGVA